MEFPKVVTDFANDSLNQMVKFGQFAYETTGSVVFGEMTKQKAAILITACYVFAIWTGERAINHHFNIKHRSLATKLSSANIMEILKSNRARAAYIALTVGFIGMGLYLPYSYSHLFSKGAV